ncbi:type II toxin-antitoxin system RelE/ParE family toxin [Actinomadura sp. 7K534]|uniref:type II toxin-antitoxin system RelE/ParE family toxin n=1 Tax=Actinomadura sp. 7K534 TaxID=2530366 RepID=UPI0032674A9B
MAEEWEIRVTNEFLVWIDTLDERSKAQAVDAIDRLAEGGPALGRPMVDRLEGSEIHDLKELRPGSAGAHGGSEPVRLRPVAIGDPPGGRRSRGTGPGGIGRRFRVPRSCTPTT